MLAQSIFPENIKLVKTTFFFPKRLSIFLYFLILLSSCDSREKCQETVFEVLEIGLRPRATVLTGGWGTWDDANELGIDRLILEMEMPKNYSLIENPECPTTFRNSNPAVDVRLISNKDFNLEYPAGSDLTDILDYSFFLQDFTKEEFIQQHFNGSNWSSFHLIFNENTTSEALHSLVLIAELEDGSIMESPPIEVLLIPYVE